MCNICIPILNTSKAMTIIIFSKHILYFNSHTHTYNKNSNFKWQQQIRNFMGKKADIFFCLNSGTVDAISVFLLFL